MYDDDIDACPAHANPGGPARIHVNDLTAEDDAANYTNATHDAPTVATYPEVANIAAGPVILAVCWVWNWITHG